MVIARNQILKHTKTSTIKRKALSNLNTCHIFNGIDVLPVQAIYIDAINQIDSIFFLIKLVTDENHRASILQHFLQTNIPT